MPCRTPQSNPAPLKVPAFGSDEHHRRLSKMLERNCRFQQEIRDYLALGLDEHRARARQLAAEQRVTAA